MQLLIFYSFALINRPEISGESRIDMVVDMGLAPVEGIVGCKCEGTVKTMQGNYGVSRLDWAARSQSVTLEPLLERLFFYDRFQVMYDLRIRRSTAVNFFQSSKHLLDQLKRSC